MPEERIIIVGAGPAGSRAAETLYNAGCRSLTVIAEAPASGGQIYRRQPPGFGRDARALYGADAAKATELHRSFDAISNHIDYRPNTLVWNIFDNAVFTSGPAGVERLPFSRIILTTGAMDRIVPIPGWTLPGVFTLGGAQIALKAQACAIGRSVVFAGTGPLLYLVAYQYVKAGANVIAVLDSSSFLDKVKAAARMASMPSLLLRGLGFRRYLAKNGVPIREGVRLLGVEGQSSVTSVRYSASGRAETIMCDALGLGFGLTPEMHLADLAGCQTRFDATSRQWVVCHDGEGRAADRIYVAGDGSAIGGADVAELTGERSALALLADTGSFISAARIGPLNRKLRRHATFRRGAEASFPFPAHWIGETPDETILCRCENVTFGDARAAIATFGPNDVNRLKALARPGMGRCQGRVCGPVLAELLAASLGEPLANVGRLRGQAPVKPIAYAAAATQASAEIQAFMSATQQRDIDENA